MFHAIKNILASLALSLLTTAAVQADSVTLTCVQDETTAQVTVVEWPTPTTPSFHTLRCIGDGHTARVENLSGKITVATSVTRFGAARTAAKCFDNTRFGPQAGSVKLQCRDVSQYPPATAMVSIDRPKKTMRARKARPMLAAAHEF